MREFPASTVRRYLAGPEATEAAGAALARACAGGCLVYLHGDLGAGKTTLVRGFLRALGHAGIVKSPTYTLVEPYRPGARAVYHFDLYRLADAEELEYLGLRDYLENGAVCLVEWPERGAGVLPPADLRVDLAHAGEGRGLEIHALSPAGRRVLDGLELQD